MQKQAVGYNFEIKTLSMILKRLKKIRFLQALLVK